MCLACPFALAQPINVINTVLHLEHFVIPFSPPLVRGIQGILIHPISHGSSKKVAAPQFQKVLNCKPLMSVVVMFKAKHCH